MSRLFIAGLLLCGNGFCATEAAAPFACSSGGPIGNVDLRVSSPLDHTKPLPLRNINMLEEGDVLSYRPILRPGEQERKGEVTIVLIPAKKASVGEKMAILEPKDANKPQQWKIPWRVSLFTFVYGPAGLNTKKVERFLSRDDELVGQLADYADKTAKTEALIAQLVSTQGSDEAFQSALQGFSSQFGINAQISRTAPTQAQASALFHAINPAVANYDPLSAQGTAPEGQTASLAASVGELFFGTPVGLAAGGTALLLDLHAMAFPNSEFRSSFSQPLPDDGVGLCGKVGATQVHTRIAYLWAMRVPNAGPPGVTIGKENSLPASVKSPLPMTASDDDWKYIDRAREWLLQPDSGKPVSVKVQKLGDTKKLELDLGKDVKPGRYRLEANWDWDHFQVKGTLDVRALSDFASASLVPSSQDRLVAMTGKVPVTLGNSDFEFVTKVQIEKLHDEFASPAAAPFVLPQGLREGPQNKMDIQIDTADLEAGSYQLMLSQVDGKAHSVNLKILTAPPTVDGLPLVLNEGATTGEFVLKGQRLDLLKRLEVASGSIDLAPASPGQTLRGLTLKMASGISAGTSFEIKAFIEDRSEPLILSDAVRIVGPRPDITDVTLAQPTDQSVQLDSGELPVGAYLSAMLSVEHLQSNSLFKLGCQQQGGKTVTLHLGDHSGALSAHQLTPNQVFLSFDTGAWRNGCILQASVTNDGEGESAPHRMGRLVLVPHIDKIELTNATAGDSMRADVTGQNLEAIEKIGWTVDRGDPVKGLPLPVGDGQRQRLETVLDPAPDADTALFVWLRNESKPRVTTVHPILPAPPPAPAPPVSPAQDPATSDAASSDAPAAAPN